MRKTLLLLMVYCCVLWVDALAQQSPPGGKDYRILHVNKQFTPQRGFRADNKSSRISSGNAALVQYNREDYFLVQFEQLPSENQKARLKSLGVTLLDYMPNLAWYAHFRQSVASDELQQLGVRTVIPVDESLRLSEALYNNRIPAHARKGNKIEVEVTLFSNADKQRADNNITLLATIVSREQDNTWKVLVAPDNIKNLAGIKEIKYIEVAPAEPSPEDTAPVKEDIFSNDHGRSNFLNTGFGGLLYNGSGVNVMVRELGMYKGPDLQGRVMDGTWQPGDPTSHASSVAGYLGSAGNVNPRDRSNAWGANILGISGQNTYTLYDDPAKKIRVTNMSYGWTTDPNAYSSTSREHDNFLRTRPEAMLVYSSGNDGGDTAIGGKYSGIPGYSNITGMPKQAKNLLTVSGTDYEDNFLDWTCKGPTYDGRLKPELTIEGVGGTSFAAPKVSGILAILYQAYKTETQSPIAPAALMKAVLMNTADDVFNPGIDFKTGFGRPNVRRAYQVIHNKQFFSDSLLNGDRKTFSVNVPAGTSQLRVMLYWHDYEATPGAAQALVNDLDLTVSTPSGSVALPWGLDTTATIASLNALPTRKEDHINNQEQITIDNPAAGNYDVLINGFNIPQGPQDFYIVYEFVKEEVVLSYPLGGESMIPGQQEYIRWDAFGTPGVFKLEYSKNTGATWDTIATGIAATKRQYKWTVPDIAAKILVRVSSGAQSNISGVVHVLPAPAGMQVDWVCDNAMQLSWRKLPQAASYEVFKLGQQYMEVIGTSTDTTFSIAVSDISQESWYAVRAIGQNGEQGQRCIAIKKAPGLFKCNHVITGIAFNVRKDSVQLGGSINALGKTLTDVKFEYGPTTAYGQVGDVPGTFTGTSFTHLQQQVPVALHSGETWHYRLKGNVDGVEVSGEDHSFQPTPGYAMKFSSGTTMTLGPNDAVNGNKPRTIECFVKTSVYNSDGGVITLPGGTGTTRGDFTLATNGADNQWKLSLWNATRSYNLPADNKGEWHHMAITYNPANTTAELYYDGILWDSWNTGGPLTTLPGNIRLGLRENGGAQYYNGEMDEVRIWSTVRTADQIRGNMHHPLNGNEPGLVYYVNFDNMEPESYEVVNKTTLTQTGTPLKQKAAFAFGNGATFVSTEAPGSVAFGNADVTATYQAQETKQVSFSKIELTSAPAEGLSATASRVGSEFWIGHRYATTGSTSMQLVLKNSADITPADVANPAGIMLFTRPSYGSGKWQFSGNAVAADSIANTVTVGNQTSYQQYLLLKDEHPFVYVSADSLLIADARAGAVTRAAAISLSGANLSAQLKVTAPAGFEISLNDTAYVKSDSSLLLATTGGALKDARIFVRFAPDSARVYEGKLRISADTTTLGSVSLKQEAVAVETTAGRAMNFDGNGDYLEIQQLNWKPTEFTIEWWLKARSSKNYNQSIGNGWGTFLVHADNTGGLNVGVANNANSRLLVPGAFSDLNTWHHYAYTFKNGEAKIYRDGKLIDSKPASSLPSSWSTFRIGAAGADAIDGELDEFRMWTTARTQQQIRENMHLTLKGAEPELKLCLQFQDAKQGVVDISDNGYPVRLFNATRITSNAPVAAGISETKQITAAGTTDFPQAGISVDLPVSGPEVVVSKLKAVPVGAPAGTVYRAQYWIVRQYDDSANVAISSVRLHQAADSLQNLRLSKRAFNAFAGWQQGAAGSRDTIADAVIFAAGNTELRNSQLVFIQSANAAPVFTPPADIIVYSNDTCGFNADTVITGSPTGIQDDTDPLPVVVYTDVPQDGQCVGSRQIRRIWSATDIAGRSSSHAQLITVKDTLAPQISCKKDTVRIPANGGCTYLVAGKELDITATDNCSAVTLRYTLSGATTGTGTSLAGIGLNAGTTTIEWQATDACDNRSTCRFTVTVPDKTAPVVACAGNLTYCNDTSGYYNVPLLTAKDNCGIAGIRYEISGATVRSGTGNNASGKFNAGTSVIIWTVTDNGGNTSSCRHTVTVHPPLNVIVPDIFAVSPGGAPNTLYNGYGPIVMRLEAKVTGGTAPYTYNWSNGSRTTFTLVSGLITGTADYTVTVKDAKGCIIRVKKQITVRNIRCGLLKVNICYQGRTLCVYESAVRSYLTKGAMLGGCTAAADASDNAAIAADTFTKATDTLAISVSPNPSAQHFTLQLDAPVNTPALIRVYDLNGRVVEEIRNADRIVRFGANLLPGTYIVEVIQGHYRKTVRVIRL